ncbi:MAG: hypothetical protein K9L30_09535 [Desulfobacterales bacterium]|nr:hypothetical protein [Desulfobacterales bacterium]
MIIKKGEKIHVITRRGFESDIRRHFIGEIVESSDILARAEGFVYVPDLRTNQFIRRPDKRLRFIGLADSGNIIHILPANADIEQAMYSLSKENRMVVSDGKSFTLEINEFSSTR